MADISKITLPSGTTYNIKDSTARSEIEAIAKAGLVFKIVETLPTASADTMGIVHLVSHSHATGDTYDEFLTIKGGTEASPTYTWERIGNTDVDLSGYAEKGGPITVSSGTAASKKTGVTVAAHTVTQGTTSSTLYYTTDEVYGTGTTFTNSDSAVSFSGGSNDTFVKSYPGSSKKLETTSITGTNGTVSIPNVTANTGVTATKISSYGTLPSFTATVANETLTLGFSAGALAQGSDVSATKVTLGTAISAAKVASSATTVATGKTASSDTNGASVLVGLGTATTASAVTAVGTATAAAQSITVGTSDKVTVVKTVSGSTSTGASNISISGTNSGIAVSAHSVTDNGHTHTITGSGTIDN